MSNQQALVELTEGDDAEGHIYVIEGALVILPRRKFAVEHVGRHARAKKQEAPHGVGHQG